MNLTLDILKEKIVGKYNLEAYIQEKDYVFAEALVRAGIAKTIFIALDFKGEGENEKITRIHTFGESHLDYFNVLGKHNRFMDAIKSIGVDEEPSVYILDHIRETLLEKGVIEPIDEVEVNFLKEFITSVWKDEVGMKEE